MKNLIFLPIMLVLLLASCQKEETEDRIERLNWDDKREKYFQEQPNINFEFTTLEEANKMNLENGFEEIALEDLGITQEEYNGAQERIKSSLDLRQSCYAYTDAFLLGDINFSMVFNYADVIMAKQVLVGNLPSYWGYSFGYFSVTWYGTNELLTGTDIVIATKIAFGIFPCDM